MSVGPELEARTARGAMLYDGSCIDQPRDALFDPGFWRSRGALEEVTGGRGSVSFVHEGTRRWVLRHYRRGGLVARFLDDTYLWTGADRTRAFVEWRLLRRLVEWRLPVPRPVAARYSRTGLVCRADLITEELPTRLTLAQALAARPLGPERWRAIGRCVGSLHARGVRHADLNAHNLLLGEDDAVYVLDFDRGRVVARGRWEQAVLERLHRSIVKTCRDLPRDRFGADQWREFLGGVEQR